MTDINMYKVTLRGNEFLLSRNQIEFDAPNLFTQRLLAGPPPSSTPEIRLDRNPRLFALILEYLSGYPILPLSKHAIAPPSTIEHLVADASFYGLSRLHALLTTPVTPAVFMGWFGLGRPVVRFTDVVAGRLPAGVEWTDKGLCAHGCPVLIHEQNLPLMLSGTMHMSGGALVFGSERLACSFSGRTTPAGLRGVFPRARFTNAHTFIADSEGYEDAGMTLDGRRVGMSALTPWWRFRTGGAARSELPSAGFDMLDAAFPLYEELPDEERAGDTPAWGAQDRRRSTFALWADEVLFVMQTEVRDPDWSDVSEALAEDAIAVSVKVLDVKARTRAGVLADVRAPTVDARVV